MTFAASLAFNGANRRRELDRLREVFGSFVSSDLRVIRHQLDPIDARVRAR